MISKECQSQFRLATSRFLGNVIAMSNGQLKRCGGQKRRLLQKKVEVNFLKGDMPSVDAAELFSKKTVKRWLFASDVA